MPYVASWGILGLERDAGTVGKAATDCPASLLLEGRAAR